MIPASAILVTRCKMVTCQVLVRIVSALDLTAGISLGDNGVSTPRIYDCAMLQCV